MSLDKRKMNIPGKCALTKYPEMLLFPNYMLIRKRELRHHSSNEHLLFSCFILLSNRLRFKISNIRKHNEKIHHPHGSFTRFFSPSFVKNHSGVQKEVHVTCYSINFFDLKYFLR